MEKEKVTIVAQLLTSMKEAVSKLEAAFKSEDAEQLAAAKKEILELQRQIDQNI